MPKKTLSATLNVLISQMINILQLIVGTVPKTRVSTRSYGWKSKNSKKKVTKPWESIEVVNRTFEVPSFQKHNEI